MRVKLLIVSLLLIGLSATAVGVYNIKTPDGPDRTITKTNPSAEDEEIIESPKTLEIPVIKVTASVEKVGLLPNGGMDVPKVYENVAWFKDGYYPAERGNAVISGHVDTPQGERAVFADLNKVEPGNFLILWGEEGGYAMFKVYDKKVYKVDEFPLELVFGKSGERNLNLITCEGEMINGLYPERLVIFARKV